MISSGAPWRRPRGRGKLKMLPEMPLDILFEIFSFLNPLGVMRLARTTKALRTILLSRSAIVVWKQAFKREPDLPDMPNDMIEPQWANLLFSNHCHFCFSVGDYYMLWAFRVRCCDKCMKGRFASQVEVFIRLAGKMICKHPDLLLRANVRSKGSKTETPYARSLCGFADAKAVNLQLAKLKHDKDRLDTFITERRKTVAETDNVVLNLHRFFRSFLKIMQFVLACERSAHLRKVTQLREAADAREARNQRVFERLRNLGYGNEVELLNEVNPTILSEHPSIRQLKELTERAWTNMSPALIELMEDTRRKILRKQRKSLLKARLRLISDIYDDHKQSRLSNEIIPCPADICNLPQVRVMLEDPAPDAFATAESFAELREQFPRLCEEWVTSKNRELVSLMPQNSVVLIPDPDEFYRLKLATTFFKCSECIEPISYPRVLVHRCLTTLRLGSRNREDNQTLIHNSLDCEPWNTGRGNISYFNSVEASAKFVLESYGVDADVVTAADLNDMDKWLECLRCRHPTKGRQVFKWKQAMLHDMNHVVSDHHSAVWTVLSNDDAKLAQKKEDELYLSYLSDSDDFVCVRCDDGMTSMAALKSHFRFRHGVQDLKKEDYRIHLDAAQPPFSVTIPNLASASDATVIDLVTPPPDTESQCVDSDYDDLYV